MHELRWILLAGGVLLVAYLYWRGRAQSGRKGGAHADETRRIEPDLSALRVPGNDRPARREPTLGAGQDAPIGVRDEGSAHSAGQVRHAAPRQARPAQDVEQSQAGTGAEEAQAGTGAVETRVGSGGMETLPSSEPRAHASDTPPKAEKIIALRLAAKHTNIPGDEIVAALLAEGLEHGQFEIFHRHSADSGSGKRKPEFSIASMVEPGTIDVDRADEWSAPGLALFMVLPGPRNGAAAFTDMMATARRLADSLGADILDDQGSTVTRQTAHHIREEIIQFEHRLQNPDR